MPDDAARTMQQRRAGIVRTMLLYGFADTAAKESLVNGARLAGKT